MKMEKEHKCQQKEESRLYRIGMFAQMNHVTIKTLHYYEEQQLLSPHGLMRKPAIATTRWIK